jgi:hypothetical protein
MFYINSHKKFPFALLLLALLSYGFDNNYSTQNPGQGINIDSILIEWKTDSIGCKGLRSNIKAELLRDSLKLENQYPQSIIDLLGKANSYILTKKHYVIRYYYQTFCHSDKHVESVDYCWVDFIYEDSKINKCKMISRCY